MIKYFNKYCKKSKLNNNIYIDKDFPKNILIKIMQPYLQVYFTSIYSMIPNIRFETNIFFKKIMIKFNNFNTQFGRKKYKILFKNTSKFKIKVAGKIIEFDDRHPPFNNTSNVTDFFLNDHLIYNAGYNVLNYFLNDDEENNDEDEVYEVEEDDDVDDDEIYEEDEQYEADSIS
jgi:hypothetical protein